MRRILRYLGYTLGALAVLVLVAFGVVYAMSERIIARTYDDAPVPAVAVPRDSMSRAKRGIQPASLGGFRVRAGTDLPARTPAGAACSAPGAAMYA